MDELAADFLDNWLEENVTHFEQATPRELATLALRCVTDAHRAGIPLESLESVVGNIAEAIQDEIEFQSAVRSLATKH